MKPLAVTGEMDVDFAREKLEVFRQAWTYLRDNFFDPKFHGANWNEVRERYQPLAAGARTPDELRRIISQMLGELNASHLGISAPAARAARSRRRAGWDCALIAKSMKRRVRCGSLK